MKKFSDFIVKHKMFFLFLTLILVIPAIIGFSKTKTNYDILVYLPSDIETIKGQGILKDEFGIGAFSVSVVENVNDKDLLYLEDQIRNINCVNDVFTIDDLTGISIPLEMIPTDVLDKVAKDNTKLMLITFSTGTSDDETMDAVKEISELSKQIKVGGMSSLANDTKTLVESQMVLYVVVAVICCLVVLNLSLDSYVVPILLLGNIGISILFNMGTNVFFGEISYITKAIAAVLQLGVTTDFSIFLYHKYESAKEKNKTNEQAMSEAIRETMTSVIGSSLTTIAGFLALCSMKLKLGTDIGLVMAKGVVFGVITVLTLYPSLLLIFNKAIEKSKHKPLIPEFKFVKPIVMKGYKLIFVLFLLLLIPAYLSQNHTEVYYKLDSSIPDDYSYTQSSKILKEDYGIISQEIVLVSSNKSDSEINNMIDEINNLEGIDSVLAGSLLAKNGISENVLPSKVRNIMKTDNYKLVLINSDYEIASNELNEQISNLKEIVKKYDDKAIIAGEGPLMNDLVEITAVDFKNVNFVSIGVIFLIMFFVLKSISLPVLLVIAIEFAIFINMGIPYWTDTSLPFISSVVIGTIQLGATIDYAILMTNKYLDERKNGKDKKDAVGDAISSSVSSIFVSAMCFFAATGGVYAVSKIDMIGSLCLLMARGAIISMLVVMFVIPSILLIFDKFIIKTTLGFGKEEILNEK